MNLINELNVIATKPESPYAGVLAVAAASIYAKNKNSELAEAIVKTADALCNYKLSETDIADKREFVKGFGILFAAYGITGSEQYKEKITSLEKSAVECGIAFDMKYETIFGGKEHYHDLATKWAKLGENIPTDEMDRALFILDLIESIDVIEQPVYEHYRAMVDIFRRTVKSFVKVEDFMINVMNTDAAAVTAYAIKKACNMKVLLAEKYADKAEKTFFAFVTDETFIEAYDAI